MIFAWILFISHVILLIIGAMILVVYRKRGDAFKPATSMDWPNVSVVSSVKGISGGFDEGLACLWNQDYKAKIEIVIIIEDLDDPAIAHLELLRKSLPANANREIRLLTGRRHEGANPRNRKMLYGFEESKYEWVLWHAIDTTFADTYFQACATLTQNNAMTFVTGFPINHSAENFGAHLETTCLNLEVTRVFLMSLGQKKRGPVYGGAIFAHRSLYQRSEVMEIISWRLTEDVIFGTAFAKAGADRIVHPWPAYVRQSRQTFKAFISRQVRWMMIARYHLKPEYFFGLSSFLVPFFLIAALIFQSLLLVKMAAFYFALRLAIAFLTQVTMKLPKSDWWQIWNLIVYDLLNPVFWFLAMVKHQVNWAGDVMNIGPSGELRRSTDLKNL